MDPRFGGRRLVMGLAAVKPEIKKPRFDGRTIVMGLAAVKEGKNEGHVDISSDDDEE
jgi:hypothetical protein